MSTDSQDDTAREVTTGLPQGSPISPVLFATYVAEIHEAVQKQVEVCQGISFVDGVIWLAEGTNISKVVQRLDTRRPAQSWLTTRLSASNAQGRGHALQEERILAGQGRKSYLGGQPDRPFRQGRHLGG